MTDDTQIPEPSRLDRLKEEYMATCHAMQTGVAYTMEFDTSEVTPKHLRVGINTAHCTNSAIVHLLIAKGIITEEEYFEKVVELLKTDVEDYKKKISEQYGGADINLI